MCILNFTLQFCAGWWTVRHKPRSRYRSPLAGTAWIARHCILHVFQGFSCFLGVVRDDLVPRRLEDRTRYDALCWSRRMTSEQFPCDTHVFFSEFLISCRLDRLGSTAAQCCTFVCRVLSWQTFYKFAKESCIRFDGIIFFQCLEGIQCISNIQHPFLRKEYPSSLPTYNRSTWTASNSFSRFLSLRTNSSHIGWDTMMLQIQGWPTQHWAERSAFFWRSKRCTRWTSAGNDRWRGVGEYAHHFPKFFMWCIMAHYGAFQIVCFPFFRARMRVTAWIKTTLPGFCS